MCLLLTHFLSQPLGRGDSHSEAVERDVMRGSGVGRRIREKKRRENLKMGIVLGG